MRETVFRIAKASEHALTYVDPLGREGSPFVAEGLEYLVKRSVEMPADVPPWFDRIALFRIACTHPGDLVALDPGRNGHRVVLRPWSRIAVAVALKPPGVDPDVPIAAWHEGFDSNRAEWRDFNFGVQLRLAIPGERLTEPDLMADRVRVRTMRDVFAMHCRSVDPKTLSAERHECRPDSRGLVTRAPTVAATVALIGKETRRLEVVGVTQGPEYVTYQMGPQGSKCVAKRTPTRCVSCGQPVIGRRGKQTCGATCRQRLRRLRAATANRANASNSDHPDEFGDL